MLELDHQVTVHAPRWVYAMKNGKFVRIAIIISLMLLLLPGALSCDVTNSIGEILDNDIVSRELAEASPDAPEPAAAPETPAQAVSSSPLPVPARTPSPKTPAPEEEISPEPEPEEEPLTAWPVWMSIPAIGVDAEVQDTGVDEVVDSMAIVPSGSIISWWRGSSIPGNEGNAIFGGHNKWGGEYGQLYFLDNLEIGDEMIIFYDDGTSLNFRLESVFVYLLATAPANLIMDVNGDARVTIITCKEPFNPNTGTSDYRIIAIFKEESVFEVPDPPIEPFPPRES